MERENEILKSILKKVTAIKWWARLRYPDNRDWWTEEESAIIKGATRSRGSGDCT